jgi:hypothetical protein
VPRSTLHAWQAYHDSLGECPLVKEINMKRRFRRSLNQVHPGFPDRDDAPMIQMLNPDEDTVRVVSVEAHRNGAWQAPDAQRLFAAAANPRQSIVTIRAGAHQIEDQGGHGSRFHIGALFEGKNWHLNYQQTPTGRLCITKAAPLRYAAIASR